MKIFDNPYRIVANKNNLQDVLILMKEYTGNHCDYFDMIDASEYHKFLTYLNLDPEQYQNLSFAKLTKLTTVHSLNKDKLILALVKVVANGDVEQFIAASDVERNGNKLTFYFN